MGGWSGERAGIRPNELLHWHAMRWGREAGYRWYDLEGIDPHTARAVLRGERPEKIDGLTHFKLGFGGEVVTLPGTYDRAYKTGKARLVGWASAGADRWLPVAERILRRRP